MLTMFATCGSTSITYRECVQIARSYIEDAEASRRSGHKEAAQEYERNVTMIVMTLPMLFGVRYGDVICDVYRDFVPMSD